MATAAEVLELRDYINEPDDSNGWSDTKLSGYIDRYDSALAAAARVWSVKASEFSSLVDVSESGSSRKLSDLYKNATSMAAHYSGLNGGGVVAPSDSPVVSRIRRGF